MAAPAYATNLNDITLSQSTTGYTAVGGGGAITAETDFYIQNGTCVSKATAATWDSSATPRGGVLYNAGTGLTIPTDGAVLTWIYWWGPGVLDTKAAGGVEINFGNSTTAYYGQYVSGSDDWEFGGWRCYPVDPNITSRDRTQGTPNGTWQYFGWQAYVASANSIGKGNPFGIDAIRYGRCDIVATLGDSANGYATFAGAAAWDNDGTRRLGLLTPRDGAYYLQGLLQLGTSGTSVDFRDSNRTIFIQNTEKVSTNFNKIEIHNASSRVDWTAIVLRALGINAKGNFEVVDDADINFNSNTFTDMGTFIFKSNSTILETIFRRCDLITQNAAIIDGCTFDKSPASVALLVSNLNNVDNSTFISTGTGHAIELTTAHAAGSYTLTGTTFTGYASTDGSTGNEAIYNNSSGAVTITISGGTIPSIRNGSGASTTIVSNAVTIKLISQKADGTKIPTASAILAAASGGYLPYRADVTITNSGTTATVTHTAHGLVTNEKILIDGASHTVNNGVFSITKIDANSYSYVMASAPGSSPTGSIKATFVFLFGTTDVNGEISVSKSMSSAQPVYGWARKATSQPYYKTGQVAGTVTTDTGGTFTAVLILDE